MDTVEVTATGNTLLGPIAALARQRKTWSPQLLAGVVWRGLGNLGAHRRVVRLLKSPVLAETARNTPRFAFKYLTHDYLARGLSTEQRAGCFLHHYRRLQATFPESFLRQVLLRNIQLHAIELDDHRFAVTLCLSRDYDKEGEMSLNFSMDGGEIFLMTFTIVPGEVVHSEAREVLLISRVQGMKGVYRQVHQSTKILYEVAPDAILLAALQGIALACGIGEVAAVTAARQSSYTQESADEFCQAYDRFFQGLDIPQSADGFFRTPVPIDAKPLTQIKRGHKIRTKIKRAFKQSVQQACAEFIAAQMLPGNRPALPLESPFPAE